MLLAAPAALSGKASMLPTFGFVINALCYLAVVMAVWLTARRLSPGSASLAAALVVLSGHTVFAMFSQTDMGLFAALVAGSFCAATYRRNVLLAVLVVLVALTRPEGGLLAVILIAASCVPLLQRRPIESGFLIAGLLGTMTAAAVMFLNIGLTGHALFTSVIGKGLGGMYPPSGVLERSTESLVSMVTGVFLGLAGDHRRFYLFPVAGAGLAALGLLSRRWREEETVAAEVWWLAGGAAVALMVATSGWEGVQFDRYFAWIFPWLYLYAALGARCLADLIQRPRVFVLVAVGLLAYQAIGLVNLSAALAQSTSKLASTVAFVQEIDRTLPRGSRIGVTQSSGLAFYLPNHTVHNIFGIVSPEFINPTSPRTNLEVLRHEPRTRFDFWLIPQAHRSGHWLSVLAGDPLAVETPLFGSTASLALLRADWRTLDRTDLPLEPGIQASVGGLTLVDQLDVGYRKHEAESEYRSWERSRGVRLHPVSETLRLGGRYVTEAGRFVSGGETMRVRAEPGHDLHIVLRVSSVAGLPTSAGFQRVEIPSPLTLRLSVDGADAGTWGVLLPESDEFTETKHVVPGELIRGNPIVLGIAGEYIAYGYWFYQ